MGIGLLVMNELKRVGERRVEAGLPGSIGIMHTQTVLGIQKCFNPCDAKMAVVNKTYSVKRLMRHTSAELKVEYDRMYPVGGLYQDPAAGPLTKREMSGCIFDYWVNHIAVYVAAYPESLDIE